MNPIALAVALGVGLGIVIGQAWSSSRPCLPAVAGVSDDPDPFALRLIEAVVHLEIGMVVAAGENRIVYRNDAARS